jgi:hypothetical protein
MRDVDLTGVRIEKARRVVTDKRAAGLQRLFWSPETDLAHSFIDERRKLVYLGFDLAGSNFPLQAAFPLFVSQSLDWLHPRNDDRAVNHIAAGSVHSIRLPAGETQVTVQGPSGDTQTLAATDGAALFEATASAGIYRYGAGEAGRFFAVSLTDARESDVNPRFAPVARREPAAALSSAQALEPLWPYLLALALALLALEWWVWNRSASHA